MTVSPARIFADGEMADLIRAVDWSTTPLGPMASWPDRLVGAVETMLASRQLVTLAVGATRTFLYNDAAAGHYGARHPDVLGRPMEQAFAPEYAAVRGFYDRAFAGEGVHVREQPLDPSGDGAGEVFTAYLTPVRDDAGAVIAVQMTGSALCLFLREQAATRASERERRAALERMLAGAASDLQASHDLLRGTIDSSDDIIQVFEAIRDDDGAIVDFRWVLNNRTSEERYGNVTGQRLLERNPAVVAEGIFDTFRRVTDTGRAEQAERQYRHEQFDGWFYQSVVKLGDGVATTVKVIDDWKAAQAELLRLQREASLDRLAESEGRFRTLADAAPAMLWHVGSDSTILFINRCFLEYTGRTAEELSVVDWGTLIQPDNGRDAIETLRSGIHDRRAVQSRNLIRRHDGAWRWFESVAQPLFARDGRYLGHVGVSTDVQASVEAEALLRASEERQSFLLALGDRMRAQSDVAAIVEAASALFGERLGATRVVVTGIDEAGDGGGGGHRGDVGAAGAWVDVPVTVGERPVMRVRVQRPAEHGWTDDEMALVREAADRVWVAVERTRAQEARDASEERLRRFGEASRDILWIRDATSLQWLYLTAAFEPIHGLSRDAALAGDHFRNWQDLIVAEDREHAAAAIRRVAAGEHVTFEYRIRRHSDGAIRWLRDTGFPILDADGKVVLIGGIGHDFTEVRESEQRFETLVGGIPQLVWRAASNSEWTWANAQWTAFTGQGEAEYLGCGWLDAVHPDDRAAVRAAWRRARAEGVFQGEYRLRRRQDGAYRWAQTRATAMRDDNGVVTEWLGTSTDMDEARRMQELQGMLLAELQHRVRNILAVIRSIISRSDDGERSAEDYVHHLQGRIASLARTQVLLTRSADAGIDLENMIRDELLAQVVGEEQFALDGDDVTLSPKAAEVLTLAIHELATNATKYGAFARASGRLLIRWTVEGRAADRRLVLEWIESGVPIVDAAPRRIGFGHELISRRIPYEMKGEGTFELRPGGLRCRIAFPLIEGASILQTGGI